MFRRNQQFVGPRRIHHAAAGRVPCGLTVIILLAGAGVGGGSLNYANTLYRPLRPFYADRQWAHITDWEDELAPISLEGEGRAHDQGRSDK